MERISNLKALEGHKQSLKELEAKLKDFSKYEGLITSKFENIETLMNEMSQTRTKYLQKEAQLKQGN